MTNTEYENDFATFLEKLNLKGKDMNALFTANKADLMDVAMLGALIGGFLAQSVKQKATITVQFTKAEGEEADGDIADPEEENDQDDYVGKDVFQRKDLKYLRDQFIFDLAESGATPLQISQMLRMRLRFINNLLRNRKGE